MPLDPSDELSLGDVVAVHGTVEAVSLRREGEESPTLYRVRLPGIAPVFLSANQIASVVSRRLERGDLVTVTAGKHKGAVARVLATDEQFAFLSTSGIEPYGVHLSDVKVIRRASEGNRQC